jgi:4-hydroxy-3-polyprenylbenzoate decarboxylase
MKLIIAVTGASGAIYAKRLLEVLREKGHEIHLIVSKSAKIVVEHELDGIGSLTAEHEYDESDMAAPMASGSNMFDAMVIVPASMKTIGALASGFCDNLITRAADVYLKEGRPLIIVPRETPLHAVHLENMARVSWLGATVLPAMPGFYHQPESVGDLVDFIVGKILNQLGIEHDLFKPWGG